MGYVNHEAAGSELACNLLDSLLNSKTQAESIPAISNFLESIGNIRGTNTRRGACAGASVILVEIFLLGMGIVLARGAEK